MKTFSDNEIKERFNKLPPSLRETIYNADIAEVIVKTSEKYGVTGRNISNVAGEIGYVILGFTKPEELPSRLSERLDMKPSDAILLAKDIYQNVLKPLAAELKRLYGLELSESVFNAKPAPSAPRAESQKPAPVAPQAVAQKPTPLVIPPRPIAQQIPQAPRQAPPAPPRPAPLPPQPVSSPPQQAPKPAMPLSPLSQAPIKPPDIPRQAPASPPPAPPPERPPEQVEPLPPRTNTPFAPRPLTPRQTPIAPLPKPQTPPRPQAPRSIFSPQMSGPLQPPRESVRQMPEKPVQQPQPRVFTPLQPESRPVQNGEESDIKKAQVKPAPLGRVVTGLAPKRPASPRDLDDPYRETVAPQEKELQQKRDAVSDPRGPQPPFQVKRGEPPYVNPKIPPIDLREDALRPPAPPDPHWEKLP